MRDERRQSARLADTLQFEIGYEGFNIASQTINISTNGLMCRLAKNIPLMTQVDLILMIPAETAGGSGRLRVKGAVVRAFKNKTTGFFHLAVFFTEISNQSRHTLKRYILSRTQIKKET